MNTHTYMRLHDYVITLDYLEYMNYLESRQVIMGSVRGLGDKHVWTEDLILSPSSWHLLRR